MNSTQALYRSMKKGEEGRVAALIADVFTEFVMPLYSPEGVQEFLKYANKEKIIERSRQNHFILVAQIGSHVMGAIEVRENRHISMLFVDGQFQRKGIGGNLIREASSICRKIYPNLDQITVNSSPNAVKAYERLGFRKSGDEQEIKGISFMPMVLELSAGDGA